MQDSTLCSILDGCIRDDPASKYVLGTYFASGWYTKSDLKKAETLYTALAEMSPPHWAARGVCATWTERDCNPILKRQRDFSK
mmetsp:Transcript_36393/g.94657  ORF Transcript_36393/g.94657 Transcript_36393/m.94657 type:complete len:83 (+) Transcript_36393:173-421(+)